MIIFPIMYIATMVFLTIYWLSFIATFITLYKIDLEHTKAQLLNITINITGVKNFNPFKLFKQLVLLYHLLTDRELLKMYREKYAEDIGDDTPVVSVAVLSPDGTSTELEPVNISDVNVLIRNIRDDIAKTMVNPYGALMYALLPDKLTVKHNLLPLTAEQQQTVLDIVDRHVKNSTLAVMGSGARNMIVITLIHTNQQTIYGSAKEYLDELASIGECVHHSTNE